MTAPLREAPSTCLAVVSPGQMGAGIGWSLREGGAHVITTTTGRSPRTAKLATSAGLDVRDGLDEVVATAAVVLVVTPPGAALDAARAVAAAARRTKARPLVADLNAVAPSTVDQIADALRPLDLVDGSISGPPPNERPGARLYLSGPRAADLANLPWQGVTPVVVDDRLGSASAVKMCTASVYKGLNGLFTQALRTGYHHGVLDRVLDDLRQAGFDRAVASVAVAATKSGRFVDEMREIAKAQHAAGLPAALFEAYAEVWAGVAETELATEDPESVDRTMAAVEVLRRLAPRSKS